MTVIRNAEMSDFEEIRRIYAHARRFMAETGNPTQWGTGYPEESLLRQDIEMRRLYVVLESEPRPNAAEGGPHPGIMQSVLRPKMAEGTQPHGKPESGQSEEAPKNARPHGVFMFAIGEDPTYLQIEDGSWLSDSRYGVIHRIAGDGEIHGLLRLAVEFCGRRIPHLRIDTHADNRIMQHTILKNGFVRCGIVHMEDGTPRIAYEKI